MELTWLKGIMEVFDSDSRPNFVAGSDGNLYRKDPVTGALRYPTDTGTTYNLKLATYCVSI